MTPLATNFDNLHQVLRNLYQEMLPLCGDMVGIAKGVAGLGALFYVAYRVWKALASAEPIDVFPLLRPFAIGLCIIMFPTVVLGTVNAVLSPVVQGTHAILEGQTTDIAAYQKQRDDLEYEARVREGKAWLADDEVYDQQLAELGIMDLGEIISMWWERTWHGIKTWLMLLSMAARSGASVKKSSWKRRTCSRASTGRFWLRSCERASISDLPWSST